MLHYNRKLKSSARTLRTHLTESEQLLWSRLRRKQILEVQFYRQKPLGYYVVDFYAPSVQLVIEADGSQHFEAAQETYDQQRTVYLKNQGLRVLRFTNLEVLLETEAVVEAIYGAVLETKNPPVLRTAPFVKGGKREA